MTNAAAVSSAVSPAEEVSWSGLVERIRTGEPSGMEELYRVFSTGVRFFLCRQLGPQDLEDKVHDIFIIVAQSIRNGDLREPERLMGYVRTVIRRQVAAHIDHAVHARRTYADLTFGSPLTAHEPDPEGRLIARQRVEVALRVLHSLPSRDREVLVRFYLREQPVSEICREMHLTGTQFRLIKSRAKNRFGELGRALLARHELHPAENGSK